MFAAAATHRFDGFGLPANFSPWRVTFMLCGASGFVVVLVLLTCREAPRGRVEQCAELVAQGRETLQHLVDRRRFFVPLYLGFASCFTAAYGAAAWSPAMLGRVFGLSPAQLAQILGPWRSFCRRGAVARQRVHRSAGPRFGDQGRLLLVAAVTLLAIPSGLAVLASDGKVAALIVSVQQCDLSAGGAVRDYDPAVAMAGADAGSRCRADRPLNTVIGAVTGPLLIALLTERVFKNPAQVGRSIAFVIVPALLLASRYLSWLRGQ